MSREWKILHVTSDRRNFKSWDSRSISAPASARLESAWHRPHWGAVRCLHATGGLGPTRPCVDLTQQHHSSTSASHSCSCPVSDEVEQEAEKHLSSSQQPIRSSPWPRNLQTSACLQLRCEPLHRCSDSDFVVKILLSHVWNQTYSRLHPQLGLRRPNSQEHLHRCAHLTNQTQPNLNSLRRAFLFLWFKICESRSFYVKQGEVLTFLCRVSRFWILKLWLVLLCDVGGANRCRKRSG